MLRDKIRKYTLLVSLTLAIAHTWVVTIPRVSNSGVITIKAAYKP